MCLIVALEFFNFRNLGLLILFWNCVLWDCVTDSWYIDIRIRRHLNVNIIKAITFDNDFEFCDAIREFDYLKHLMKFVLIVMTVYEVSIIENVGYVIDDEL
ncbi:hypothetical protein BDA99DRAFT_544286 [Phascolomyces articulosus]|uniref:Uncharacterized protein n=1 Tax=Phascolomyces articulosus TaxID=60185 RepID=A0AAD5JW85_9FUNG|nr:hypothetical protein BDA99DRAFT_544286 [Phascolomyces articulosus]